MAMSQDASFDLLFGVLGFIGLVVFGVMNIVVMIWLAGRCPLVDRWLRNMHAIAQGISNAVRALVFWGRTPAPPRGKSDATQREQCSGGSQMLTRLQ